MKPHPVEPICNIDLGQLGRSVPRVGMRYAGEKALEGAAKLHRFGQCQPDRRCIYS
jgi:hypothetical protein